VADLGLVGRLGAAEGGLAVVALSRPDATVQASVVNAGVLEHPVSGASVVGFVTYGRAKLAQLRARHLATLTFRAGWEWVSVEGACDIAGPDDPLEGLASSAVPQLLRDVFSAAGGRHDDWDAYDRAMADQRRAAVLVVPARIYSNPGS